MDKVCLCWMFHFYISPTLVIWSFIFFIHTYMCVCVRAHVYMRRDQVTLMGVTWSLLYIYLSIYINNISDHWFHSHWSFSLFQALFAKNPSITQAIVGKLVSLLFLFFFLVSSMIYLVLDWYLVYFDACWHIFGVAIEGCVIAHFS